MNALCEIYGVMVVFICHSGSTTGLQYCNAMQCSMMQHREIKTQTKKEKRVKNNRAKHVLPNTNRTQAAVSVHCHHPVTPRGHAMVSSAAELLRTAYGARLTVHCQ